MKKLFAKFIRRLLVGSKDGLILFFFGLICFYGAWTTHPGCMKLIFVMLMISGASMALHAVLWGLITGETLPRDWINWPPWAIPMAIACTIAVMALAVWLLPAK